MSSASHPPDFLASIPSTMRQWTTALDGFEKLRMEEQVPIPVPGDGEVLVKIHAVGLNMRDVQGEIVLQLFSWKKHINK